MPSMVAILGSVTPPGRFLRVMTHALDEARAADASLTADLINLADVRIAFADGRPPEQYADDTAGVVARVRGADAVILGSPVYRGSMTGALKNLLDQLPIDSLMGKPCGIVAMGASEHHYLGVDWHLRDVLVWFGAMVAPTSVYLRAADFESGEPSRAALDELAALTRALVAMCAIAPARGTPLGPAPLAARRR
jgi:FMN reductase